MEQLFPSVATQTTGTPTLAAKEIVVDLSDGVATVEDLQTKEQRRTKAWIRMMHLVEPVDVMSGDFVLPDDGALPSFRSAWQSTLRKINDPYNEAYTDAVFACMASRLVETGRSPHFCRFYGTYNTRAPEYVYNITDDMEDIEGEQWFKDGLQSGAFRIIAMDPYDPDVKAEVTRPWDNVRERLLALQGDSDTIDDDTASEDNEGSDDNDNEGSEGSEGSEDNDTKHTPRPTTPISDLEETDIEVSGKAVVNRRQIKLARLEKRSTHSQTNESEESEEDIEYRAILKNYPVQITVLERCDGTLDDLMEDEISDDATDDMRETKEQRWTAWIFQVIAGLAAAQQHYDFVHNDLHTNNVMWSGTGETHLYYHVTGAAGGDRFYRVPTFGRIMKIIDFGRATFKPPSTSNDNRTWFPDAYAPDAVAGGQYNCGPYFEQGRPKVLPNKSFDLCRLAVAMLETLWEEPAEAVQPLRVLTKEPGRITHETKSPLWNLMWMWLTDKHGKNMIRTPNDEERYPQFDLYCAIAKDVQNAVPAQQITLPLFDSNFRCRRKDIPTDAPIWKLHAVNRTTPGTGARTGVSV
jgi:hypothetical protein